MNSTAGVTDADLTRAGLSWTIPIDDKHYRTFSIARLSRAKNSFPDYSTLGMLQENWGPAHHRPVREWSLEDNQRWQTDYAAQKGQGDISLHSEDHLTRTDAGISMMRRLFKQEAAKVLGGEDPIGVTFEEPYFVNVQGANAILDPITMEVIEGQA